MASIRDVCALGWSDLAFFAILKQWQSFFFLTGPFTLDLDLIFFKVTFPIIKS